MNRRKVLIFAGAIGAVMLCAGIGIGMLIAHHNEPTAAEPTQPKPSVAALPPLVPVTAAPPVSTVPAAPPPVTNSFPQYVQTNLDTEFAPVRRAVEWQGSVPAGSGQPVILDQNGNPTQPYHQQIGRNGLLSNPCVDPPSSHGAAYSRAY